jgi:hypothetical protein
MVILRAQIHMKPKLQLHISLSIRMRSSSVVKCIVFMCTNDLRGTIHLVETCNDIL